MTLPSLTLDGLIFARMLGGRLFGLSMPSSIMVPGESSVGLQFKGHTDDPVVLITLS